MAYETLKFDAIVALAIGKTIVERDDYRGAYIPVTEGDTYVVQRDVVESNRFRVCATANEPKAGERYTSLVSIDSGLSITITIPSGYPWLFVYLSNQGDDVTVGNYSVLHEYAGGGWLDD